MAARAVAVRVVEAVGGGARNGGDGGESGDGEGGGDEEDGGEGAGGENCGCEDRWPRTQDRCGETVPPVANGGGLERSDSEVAGGHAPRATIPGTGASGAKGDVGETSGVTTVPPWSRQAGGEAVGGEEGVARVGAHG